jgi:protease-4
MWSWIFALSVVLCSSLSYVHAEELVLVLDPAPAATSKKEEAPAKKTTTAEEKAKKPITWAHIELKGPYREGAKLEGIFGESEVTLHDILGRIERATNDPAISGIFLRFNNAQIDKGQIHEFRAVIANARKKGKPVYAWTDFSMSTDYLIATACDKIYMPESGDLILTGLRIEVSFYQNLFKMLNIQADMLQIGDFKGAAEPYTRTNMSPEFRKDIEDLLDGMYADMIQTIATSRKKTEAEVKQIIDEGPYMATRAMKAGLIDGLIYEDKMDETIAAETNVPTVKITQNYGKVKVEQDFEGLTGFINLMNAISGAGESKPKSLGAKIAIIYANGPIMTGKSSQDSFFGESIGSDTLVKAIDKAAKNDSVKAIVLRINSPGGSALASDLIWNALENCKKPFVVSMGTVAASGGYYIAMGADRIFVEPNTITGSIGVVGGKLALDGLYQKFGVTHDIISRGKNSGVLSPTQPFNATERVVMRASMEEVYDLFTKKAATGRKMDVEKLKSLAGGRVYTGHQAVACGLADEIGTLEDAIQYARKLAGMEDNAKFERLMLPEAPNPFEALFGNSEVASPIQQPEYSRSEILMLMGIMLPEQTQTLIDSLWVNKLLKQEHRLLIMPYHLRFDR